MLFVPLWITAQIKKVGHKTTAVIFGKRVAAFISLITLGLVLLFSGIVSPIINILLKIGVLLVTVILLYPSEKLAQIFFRFFFVIGVISIILFIMF